MGLLQVFGRNMDHIEITDPNHEQLIAFFNQLNGENPCGLRFERSGGNISIYSSEEKRIRLYFVGYKDEEMHWGLLLDKNADKDTEVEMILENGQIDSYPLQETVSQEAAKNILTYFSQNGTVPQGLDWDGNMSGFN